MSGTNDPTIKDTLTAFGTFIWNPKERKVLGRGGRSWAELGLFYLVYYSCLVGFFTGMLAVFYQTMDDKEPKLVGDSSLLKGNPGMGFQPIPNVEYTLVRFTVKPKSYEAHIASINKTLTPYLNAEKDGKGIDCDANTKGEGEACRVNITSLTEECNAENNFGYGREKQPCILLRLNKIFNWMPQKYTEENIKNTGISEELKQKILADPEMIYVDCVGENPADRDNIGTIKYFPEQGFRHHFYPFTNQADYMAPLVFVKFLNPSMNTALMVECRALAPNIQYDRIQKEGGVHFELLIDP